MDIPSDSPRSYSGGILGSSTFHQSVPSTYFNVTSDRPILTPKGLLDLLLRTVSLHFFQSGTVFSYLPADLEIYLFLKTEELDSVKLSKVGTLPIIWTSLDTAHIW